MSYLYFYFSWQGIQMYLCLLFWQCWEYSWEITSMLLLQDWERGYIWLHWSQFLTIQAVFSHLSFLLLFSCIWAISVQKVEIGRGIRGSLVLAVHDLMSLFEIGCCMQQIPYWVVPGTRESHWAKTNSSNLSGFGPSLLGSKMWKITHISYLINCYWFTLPKKASTVFTSCLQ